MFQGGNSDKKLVRCTPFGSIYFLSVLYSLEAQTRMRVNSGRVDFKILEGSKGCEV